MRLLAYLRVSSQGQAEADRYGLIGQEQQIRAWAKANGHEIVQTYQDVETGTVGDDIRTGLGELLNFAAKGSVPGVVAASQSRWARDAILAETLYRKLWDMDVTVFTAEEGELEPDTGDSTRVFIRRVMSAFAEYEKAQIVARMVRGKEARVEAGLPSNGHYPYGYCADGRDPEEWPVVERIIAYRDAGLTYSKIAGILDAECVYPRRANSWHPQVILDIYHREKETEANGTSASSRHSSRCGDNSRACGVHDASDCECAKASA